jgi:hypothetical protein
MASPEDLNRFFGRWHAQIGAEKVFLEFMADGRFFYTGLWGEDTKEYSKDMRHPLEVGRPSNVPIWELRDSHLIIHLKPSRQFSFDYAFANNNQNLTLTSLQTNETLTFSRSSGETSHR